MNVRQQAAQWPSDSELLKILPHLGCRTFVLLAVTFAPVESCVRRYVTATLGLPAYRVSELCSVNWEIEGTVLSGEQSPGWGDNLLGHGSGLS
jgi:hypothetical protein